MPADRVSVPDLYKTGTKLINFSCLVSERFRLLLLGVLFTADALWCYLTPQGSPGFAALLNHGTSLNYFAYCFGSLINSMVIMRTEQLT